MIATARTATRSTAVARGSRGFHRQQHPRRTSRSARLVSDHRCRGRFHCLGASPLSTSNFVVAGFENGRLFSPRIQVRGLPGDGGCTCRLRSCAGSGLIGEKPPSDSPSRCWNGRPLAIPSASLGSSGSCRPRCFASPTEPWSGPAFGVACCATTSSRSCSTICVASMRRHRPRIRSPAFLRSRTAAPNRARVTSAGWHWHGPAT